MPRVLLRGARWRRRDLVHEVAGRAGRVGGRGSGRRLRDFFYTLILSYGLTPINTGNLKNVNVVNVLKRVLPMYVLYTAAGSASEDISGSSVEPKLTERNKHPAWSNMRIHPNIWEYTCHAGGPPPMLTPGGVV